MVFFSDWFQHRADWYLSLSHLADLLSLTPYTADANKQSERLD